LRRAAVLRDLNFNGDRQFTAIESVAPSLNVTVSPISFYNAAELEPAIAAFASEPDGGLVVTAGTWATVNSQTIIDLPLNTGCLRSTPIRLMSLAAA
jgi:hypothetical protein